MKYIDVREHLFLVVFDFLNLQQNILYNHFYHLSLTIFRSYRSTRQFPSHSGPPTSPDYSHNTCTERSKGTCRTSGPRLARWRGWSCSAALREGTGDRLQGTVCGAWAGWFCRGQKYDFLSYGIIDELAMRL